MGLLVKGIMNKVETTVIWGYCGGYIEIMENRNYYNGVVEGLGTTGDYCRYTKALLIPYLEAMTIGEIDLKYTLNFTTNHGAPHMRVLNLKTESKTSKPQTAEPKNPKTSKLKAGIQTLHYWGHIPTYLLERDLRFSFHFPCSFPFDSPLS